MAVVPMSSPPSGGRGVAEISKVAPVAQDGSIDLSQLDQALKDLSKLSDAELERIGVAKEDRSSLEGDLKRLIEYRDKPISLFPPEADTSGRVPTGPTLSAGTMRPEGELTQTLLWWQRVDDATMDYDPVPFERFAVYVAYASGETDPKKLNVIADRVYGLIGVLGVLGAAANSESSVDKTSRETSSNEFNTNLSQKFAEDKFASDKKGQGALKQVQKRYENVQRVKYKPLLLPRPK